MGANETGKTLHLHDIKTWTSKKRREEKVRKKRKGEKKEGEKKKKTWTSKSFMYSPNS